MMNTSFGPTLDVAFKTEGESIRLFYLIEDKEPSTKKVANYVKNLQNAGLEVIQITGEERKDFKLDKGFQGYAVFVQKHDEDDPDFTPEQTQVMMLKKRMQKSEMSGNPTLKMMFNLLLRRLSICRISSLKQILSFRSPLLSMVWIKYWIR